MGRPIPFATRVFLDENRLEWADARRQYEESRWIAIGLIDGFEISISALGDAKDADYLRLASGCRRILTRG